MHSLFRRRLIASFTLITAVLLAVGAMVYGSVIGLIEDMARITHTQVVIGTLSETLSQVEDAETQARGYVITGQESYLESYRAARPALQTNLSKLKLLTADNVGQQRRLNSLQRAIGDRLSRIQTTIEMRRKQGFAAAQRRVLTGNGRRQMNVVRSLVARMDEEEERLLRLRNAESQTSTLLALGAGCSGLFIVVLIVLLMLNMVRRESERRMKVEAGLETANIKLHDSLRVMERLTQEMTFLATFAEMLQSCRTRDEAYHVIQSTLPQVLPDAAALLGLINASQNLVEIVLQIPANEKIVEPLFAPGECWALRRGHLHLVQDAGSGVLCPHLARAASGETKNPFGSMLCLPLAAHGETLGVLTILAKPTQILTEADQRVAHAVAEHISLALANLKLQETLRTQSIRDPLSGLFNRRYLEVSFEREIARAQRHRHPLSVLMLDIDFFKSFNDESGHEAGDELLKAFGGFLQSQSRSEDIACRYGGEEFTLILPEAALDVACRRAEQIRMGVTQLQVDYRRERLPEITISLGVAAFPLHGTSKEELMRAADAALYRAKEAGRNRVIAADAPAEIAGVQN